MVDGCLVADWNGGCSKCVEGAIRNEFGICDNKYVNCLKISTLSQCILCHLGYSLMNGKCINDDANCEYYNVQSGLCMACKEGYNLIGYKCV